MIEYKRVKNDKNANSRYVIHFLDFLCTEEKSTKNSVQDKFKLALKKSKQIGGKVYKGKDFGGGIVIQTTNIFYTLKQIQEISAS